MSWSIDLPWLPSAPVDLRARARKLSAETANAGAAIQALACHSLTASDAASVTKAIRRVRDGGGSLAPLSHFKLGVLSNATLDLVCDGLPAAAARHGVDLELFEAPYDQVMQQALDPNSEINKASPHAVLLAIDHRWLNLERPELEPDASARAIEQAMERLALVIGRIKENSNATVILPNLPVPALALFGSYDRRVQGTVRSLIDEANRRIVTLAGTTGSYLFDVASIAERVGSDVWFDPVQWNLYKLPFAASCIGLYCDFLGRLLGSIRGRSRKCLVLDLDNTIWGGVVGDDGVEGLKIGQGSAEGEAFLAVQRLSLELRARGVVLAVCSKNNDDTARKPFREHPDMLLKESDIAVFQANWIDKASNLEAIAKQLNIGLDALVLLDDNPAERGQVRAALPALAVPEIPADPSRYADILAAAGYFEAVTYSQEDNIRAAAYAADSQRAEVMARSRDLGDYLSSLEMVISFAPFDSLGRQRIAQLINKSNQFNLTTRRYTEAECADLEVAPEAFTLQSRLKDKFSDLGMIGVVIARPCTYQDRDALDIDTWLMSCRVLGRKVEEATLQELVNYARRMGFDYIIGRYLPTAKNGMVKDHYAKLGFALVDETPEGNRTFVLETGKHAGDPVPMLVERR